MEQRLLTQLENSLFQVTISSSSSSSSSGSSSIMDVSALDVIFNVMRSINPRFTYLLSYLLTYPGKEK